MSTKAQVQTLIPTKAELEEWDAAVEQAVESLKGKKVEAANMAAAAVQFMAVSHEDLDRVSNQGIVSRVIGFFTGRNAKLRERSQRNMLHAQKASLQLVRRLAEQNALQMDAMVALANLVNYLHFKEVETKKALLELFDDHEKRLREVEDRLAVVDRVYGWALAVPARDYLDLPNKSLRLAAYVQDALALEVPDWRSRDIDVFMATLQKAGFERRETITVRRFLHDLSHTEAVPGWTEHVLPLVEPGLQLSTEPGLPCYYALLESAALQRSEEKYAIVAVASEMAAAAGARLDPPALREEVLVRYLLGRGVNVDAEVPIAKLGVELLVGARLALARVEPEEPVAVEPVPQAQPVAKERVLRAGFECFGDKELRVHPDAAEPWAELVENYPPDRRPIRCAVLVHEHADYRDYWTFEVGAFDGSLVYLEGVKVSWKNGECTYIEVRLDGRWSPRKVRSYSIESE